MTRFIKENFYGSEYVDYNIGGPTGTSKFVARFKYSRSGKTSFINFLCKNFTVEEYFGRLEGGEAPLSILESKGFVLPHIKKELKRLGYELTPAGFRKMIDDQIAARSAKGMA